MGEFLVFSLILAAISILGIVLIFTLKNEVVKTMVYYAMNVYGLILCYLGVTSQANNYHFKRILIMLIGVSLVIGNLYFKFKNKQRPATLTLVTCIIVNTLMVLFF